MIKMWSRIPSAIYCATHQSSTVHIYRINHTLNGLLLYVDIDSDDEFEENVKERTIGQNLALLLRMNKSTNKRLVAIKKILIYHPDMNMEPLFELGAKEEGEQTIKSLPMSWPGSIKWSAIFRILPWAITLRTRKYLLSINS